nr:YciI-like protein [Marinicella sp. W31]MDC2875744.1 YciI-like protein [Marinicella sp. W31]
MLFAVLCKDKPDHIHIRMENRPRHLEWLDGLNEKGTLKIAGPFLDEQEKPCGSMLLIEAKDQTSAEAIAADDPYGKAGLFEKVEVKPYKWLYNNPGV